MIPAQSTDLTDKDFDAMRARLKSLSQSVWPQWTAWDTPSFGVLLMEFVAHIFDALEYYQGRLGLESRWTTANLRQNIIAHARLIAYELSGASAARCDLVFTLSAPLSVDVVITARTPVRTQEVTGAVYFYTAEALTIAAGALSGTVGAENAELWQRQWASTGLPDQELTLDRAPYVDDSATIAAGNGTFSQVNDFFDSGPLDRHFIVRVDAEERARVRFGNGTNGALPSGTITAGWKTGGGIAGNVDAQRLTVVEGTIYDNAGEAARLSVTNPLRATPGADRETIAHAKIAAPASLRTLTRTITREDFVTNAKRVVGVARALMLTSNEMAMPENTGVLYIVPVGGGAAPSSLVSAVNTMVTETYPHTITFGVTVASAIYKTIDISTIIHVRAGYTAAIVGAAIRAALASFFAPALADGTPNGQIGFGLDYYEDGGVPDLPWSDVLEAIVGVEGVRKIDDSISGLLLNGVRSDVILEVREFPALGNVTIVDAATGQYI